MIAMIKQFVLIDDFYDQALQSDKGELNQTFSQELKKIIC
jgi:hypothetical protein